MLRAPQFMAPHKQLLFNSYPSFRTVIIFHQGFAAKLAHACLLQQAG